MIIDIVKTNGIPFKCENCNTYFAWKPDEQGTCSIRAFTTKCKEIGCEYYEPAEKKCPECGSRHITKIPIIMYKLKRGIRHKIK